MKNWKAILGVTVVFLLGAAAGSLGTMLRLRQTVREDPGRWVQQQIYRRLASELNLNQTQREQLRLIMQETQAEIRALRKQMDPQIREILQRNDTKIRAILLEEQRQQYDELVKDRRRMFEKLDQPPLIERQRRMPPAEGPVSTNHPNRPARPPPQ
jgi:Spy/CpxP family protein refolding chaperone